MEVLGVLGVLGALVLIGEVFRGSLCDSSCDRGVFGVLVVAGGVEVSLGTISVGLED